LMDEEKDATIDYILYIKNGVEIKYLPGNMDVKKSGIMVM